MELELRYQHHSPIESFWNLETLSWLRYANADAVYDYLKKEDVGDLSSQHESDFDYMLLERNEPLINVGLALFSSNEEVSKYIYENGSKELKLLVLKGPITETINFGNWFHDEFDRLLKERETDLLIEIVRNRQTSEDSLSNFVTRRHEWADISDDDWAYLLMYFAKNDKLSVYSPKYEHENDQYISLIYSTIMLLENIEFEKFNDKGRRRIVSGVCEILDSLRNNIINYPFGYTLIPSELDIEVATKKWEKAKFIDRDARSDRWYFDHILEILDWFSLIRSNWSEEYNRVQEIRRSDDDSAKFTIGYMNKIDEFLLDSKDSIKDQKALELDLMNTRVDVSNLVKKIDSLNNLLNYQHSKLIFGLLGNIFLLLYLFSFHYQ